MFAVCMYTSDGREQGKAQGRIAVYHLAYHQAKKQAYKGDLPDVVVLRTKSMRTLRVRIKLGHVAHLETR